MFSANVQSRKFYSSDFLLKKFIPGKMDEITPDFTPALPCSPQSQEFQQALLPPTSPHSLTVCDLSPWDTFAWWVMKTLYCSRLSTFNSNRQISKQMNYQIKGFLRLKGSKEMPGSPCTVQSCPTCSTEPSLEKRGHKLLRTIILAARDHLLLKDCFIR